jgi:Cu/Ag efflux protein CusF
MMKRTVVLACCASLLLFEAATLARQVPPTKTTTATATIEAIDKASRVITLKESTGQLLDVAAPAEMEGFNNLKVGDRVTATYFQAIAVSVRKPGAPATPSTPVTTTRREDRKPGSETRKQQTFTVTVESVDPKAPALTVKGPKGRVMTLGVADAAQLQNIKAGDSVDVTYYESLMIKVARAAK